MIDTSLLQRFSTKCPLPRIAPRVLNVRGVERPSAERPIPVSPIVERPFIPVTDLVTFVEASPCADSLAYAHAGCWATPNAWLAVPCMVLRLAVPCVPVMLGTAQDCATGARIVVTLRNTACVRGTLRARGGRRRRCLASILG